MGWDGMQQVAHHRDCDDDYLSGVARYVVEICTVVTDH